MCGERLDVDENLVCNNCESQLYRVRFRWDDNYRFEQWFACFPVKKVVGFTLFKHGSLSSRLVHQLKYGGHPELGVWMGRMAATDLLSTGAFDGVDMLCPVPLAKERLAKRGYNQAEQIARGLSEVTGIKVRTDVLKRVQYKESQTHFGREERMNNTERAFEVALPAGFLEGKCVMVVDDVMTTGSTMDSAALCFKDVPRISLNLFAWAWTTD